MYTFFHLITSANDTQFVKIEWVHTDGIEVISEGEVKIDTPSYLYDFIQFLLAVGNSDTIIGWDLDFKLKVLGRVMKRTGLFQISLSKPDKSVHLDIKDKIPRPSCVKDIYTGYFNHCYEKETIQPNKV